MQQPYVKNQPSERSTHKRLDAYARDRPLNRYPGVGAGGNLGPLVRRLEEHRKVDLLERRKKDLERLLQELDREDRGFRHEIKYELAKLSCDLSGAFEDFIMSVDSRYKPRSDTR